MWVVALVALVALFIMLPSMKPTPARQRVDVAVQFPQLPTTVEEWLASPIALQCDVPQLTAEADSPATLMNRAAAMRRMGLAD